jgi:hypothetical protein
MQRGQRVAATAGLIASCGLLAISAAISFRFGTSFGRTELDASLYGSASALADVLKATMPAVAASAMRARRYILAFVAGLLFLVCVAMSFTSAVGFGIAARTFSADALTLQAQLNRSQLASLQAEQKELERTRKLQWQADLRPRQRRDLEQRARRLEAEVKLRQATLAGTEPVLSSISQADALARITATDPSTVGVILVVLLATLLEVGSGIGLGVCLAALGQGHERGNDLKVQRTEDPIMQLKARPRAKNRTDPAPKVRASVAAIEDLTIRSAISNFLLTATRMKDDASIGATDLFRAFEVHCAARGLPSFSQRAFGDEMARQGYRKDRRTPAGRVRYIGIELSG